MSAHQDQGPLSEGPFSNRSIQADCCRGFPSLPGQHQARQEECETELRSGSLGATGFRAVRRGGRRTTACAWGARAASIDRGFCSDLVPRPRLHRPFPSDGFGCRRGQHWANRAESALSSGPGNGGLASPPLSPAINFATWRLYSTRLAPGHFQGRPVYVVTWLPEFSERTWYDSQAKGLYVDRAVGGDRDHRRTDLAVAAGRPSRARGGPPVAMPQ